jgi:hypothetical protein
MKAALAAAEEHADWLKDAASNGGHPYAMILTICRQPPSLLPNHAEFQTCPLDKCR